MKLSGRHLSNLIKEAILKEHSEYFGKEFTEFKSRYEKGEDPLLVAQSMLKEIGAGATRRVFEFSDNSTVVLKVIKTDVQSHQSWQKQHYGFDPLPDSDPDKDMFGWTKQNKLQSNQWEADLTMQQLYPDVFPRTFEVADDYAWILSERVKPIKNFQELLGVINLGDETFSRGQSGQIQFQAIIEKAIEVLKPGDDEAKDDTLKSKPAKKRKPKTDLLKSRITKVLSNPHTRKMLLAIGDLDIPVSEFSAKNLGISELSGKLMLLDASIWKEHKSIRETVMKMNRQHLRQLIKETLSRLDEIGPGVGMDPTGATMPVGMTRSEYRQLEDAQTDAHTMLAIMSIVDPTMATELADAALYAAEGDSESAALVLMLSAGGLGAGALTVKALKMAKGMKAAGVSASKAAKAADDVIATGKNLDVAGKTSPPTKIPKGKKSPTSKTLPDKVPVNISKPRIVRDEAGEVVSAFYTASVKGDKYVVGFSVAKRGPAKDKVADVMFNTMEAAVRPGEKLTDLDIPLLMWDIGDTGKHHIRPLIDSVFKATLDFSKTTGIKKFTFSGVGPKRQEVFTYLLKKRIHNNPSIAGKVKNISVGRETAISLNEIRKIIRRALLNELLVEVTDLNKQLYSSLEKAIADSKFWIEGNTEDDGDYEDVPGLDLIHQTSAAQYLQDVLQATIDNAGEDIIIAVQSPELDANPGFLLTPDKPQYPDSVISGGYATITPDGKQAVILNMSLFDDSFNDDDVNAQRIARKGSAILRHEIVHLQQIAARAESEGVSLLDAFENFKKEPKTIPQSGAGRQQYIKSHIEIDAHAHQAADELLSLYGKEEALRLISKTVDFEDLGVDLPHAVEDYLIDNPSSKTARQFRKKVYEYINSINQNLNEAVEKACVLIPPQSLPWIACHSLLWIWARLPHTSWFTENALKTSLPSALRFLGFSESVGAAAAAFGALASSAIFVWGMFAALPAMIQQRIEFLDSIMGFLMNSQDARKRAFQVNKESKYQGPLEYKHLAPESSPMAQMFGESTMDRDDVINIIASQLNTPEGRSLYGKLVSSDIWAVPGIFGMEALGAKWRGPIIGRSIAIKIQKSRKELIDKANEKMTSDILKRLTELEEAGDYEKIIEFAKSLGWDPSDIDRT